MIQKRWRKTGISESQRQTDKARCHTEHIKEILDDLTVSRLSHRDNSRNQTLVSRIERGLQVAWHLESLCQSCTRISKRFLVSRGERASTCVHARYVHAYEVGTTALYSSGDPSSTPKNSSTPEEKGEGKRRRRKKKKKKKKKKQHDDGMPRPVQRPGCLRLPVISMHRILVLLQHAVCAVVLKIMDALSPNSSYVETNK